MLMANSDNKAIVDDWFGDRFHIGQKLIVNRTFEPVDDLDPCFGLEIERWDRQPWRDRYRQQLFNNKAFFNKAPSGFDLAYDDPYGFEWNRSFEFGTSENAILDNFILRKGIKWIPYNKFKNVEYLDEGGFGIAYKANWLSNDQNIEVALKYLNNLNENLDEFLNEWDFPEKCLISTWIIKTHGFTKNPDTSKYMIVFDYANRGNLRRNLTQIIENNWNQRLHKLLQIISSLNEIHELNLIHYDFHDGNILNHQVKYKENYKDKIYISDLGLCQPVKSFSKKHEIYGVIPFMAPEVLRGNPYTPASNIYSFSMIMWEFTSGVPPFNDKAHDLQLALSICKGDRPEILGNTPQCYVDLMKKCWNQNPLKRPSASEVKNIIIKWIYRPHGSFKDDEELISNIMEFINSSVVNNKPAFESHPQAFYTSRLFDFTSTEINKCLDCSVDDIKSSVAAYSNDDNDNKVSSDAKEPEDLDYCILDDWWMSPISPHRYDPSGMGQEVPHRLAREILTRVNIDSFKYGKSENASLDKFIFENKLIWIPYDQFKDVKYLDEGGFGTIYKAIWLPGNDYNEVVLKCPNYLNENLDEFLNEWNYHGKCLDSTIIIKLYGFTKDPNTSKYMVVMDYANKGSLRSNLTKIVNNNWNEKLRMLFEIIYGLSEIHKQDLIHCDFHDGNILNHRKDQVFISDLGLCRPVTSSLEENEIFGVVPFMAPEILRGDPYTPASDIYSFSMIMWEFTSGVQPFKDIAHDVGLCISICKGERPDIIENTPQCYADLMKRCWNENPLERPSAGEIVQIMMEWIFRDCSTIISEELESNIIEFISAPIGNNNLAVGIHPQAFYTSRILDFTSKELIERLESKERESFMIE